MKIKLTRSQRKIIKRSSDINTIIGEYLRKDTDKIDRMKEHFFSIGLKTNNEIKYIEVVSIGKMNGSLVGITETFRRAIIEGGIAGIILAHNHPSENRQPSIVDRNLTKKLVEAGKILDIQVLDHIIVTLHRGYFSFADEGLI